MKRKLRRELKENIRKRLQEQAHDLWKEFCRKRDGGKCQIAVYYPRQCLCTNKVVQVHHIFSRTHKNIFLDIDNGMTLGMNCHCRVSFDDAYQEIVRRIAQVKDKMAYERLHELSLVPGSFLEWKNIDWLELQVKTLRELISELGQSNLQTGGENEG